MTTTATETTTANYVVLDEAGLDALPIGTILIDSDGDPFEKVDSDTYDGIRDAFLYRGWSASLLATDVPLTIENPDVLGTFPKFQVGQTVRIASTRYPDALGGYVGMTGTVVPQTFRAQHKNGSRGRVTILPHQPYTGRYGVSSSAAFAWDETRVELVEDSLAEWERELLESATAFEAYVDPTPVFEVGQAVRVVTGRGESVHNLLKGSIGLVWSADSLQVAGTADPGDHRAGLIVQHVYPEDIEPIEASDVEWR